MKMGAKPKKPAPLAIDALGGAIPPAPTAAETAAMRKRVGQMRAKPAAPRVAPKAASSPKRPTVRLGLRGRRRLEREIEQW